MQPLFTQVTHVNGRAIKSAVDQYESNEIRTMNEAASRAAIDNTTSSGDVATVAVATARGTVRTFEVEVTHQVTTKTKRVPNPVRRCRVCGCTDDDCRQCIKKTGRACHWVEDDLCSACVPQKASRS